MKYALPLLVLFLSACGQAPTTTQMRASVLDSVAFVQLPTGGSGSGFVVEGKSGRKYIATNAHVCNEEGNTLFISFAKNGPKYVETAVKVDYANDICLVSLANQKIEPLKVVATAKPGDHVYTAGFPLGKGLTVSEGNVVDHFDMYPVGYPPSYCSDGVGSLEQTMFGAYCVISNRAIDFNAPIYPGNSGGPLLNEKGEVVGIDFASGELGGAALYTTALIKLLRKS